MIVRPSLPGAFSAPYLILCDPSPVLLPETDGAARAAGVRALQALGAVTLRELAISLESASRGR